MLKVAKELDVGTGTVQRICKEMNAAYCTDADERFTRLCGSAGLAEWLRSFASSSVIRIGSNWLRLLPIETTCKNTFNVPGSCCWARAGVEALLRDKTCPPGTAKLATATVAKILALTCSEPPGQVTHWTGRAMAKAAGVSLRSVQRIWDAHYLQPHRLRTFKRSNDPAFAEKVKDIVGLHMDPPMHTVVLLIDEKS